MYGIDTNILVYMFDAASVYQSESKMFIAESLKKEKIAIAEFTLFEFYSVITDGRKVKTPLSPFEAGAIIQDFYESESFEVFSLLEENLYNMFSYAKEKNIKRNDVYDLKIAYTLKTNGIKTIYTANTKDFKKFKFISAVNPFTTSKISQANKPKTIPYSRQSIDEKDIASVCSALRSDWLTQGPKIKEFEEAVAEYCRAKYAVAVSNGTAALHLACLAAGLGKGDVLWTSPNTFVASANCALYCGAKPDFVDIDIHTYNMSISKLETKLIAGEKNGHLPKIVIPVHFAGQSCEMEQIYSLSKKYGFTIIEDACHALGGEYKGSKVGSCKFSDITVFSFHPVKIITTGEGGMVLTNNEKLYQKLITYRTHGITRTPEFMQGEIQGDWYYEQVELGFNYRITDIQAALGYNQMQRLDKFVERRRYLARRYDALLKNLPLVIPYQHPDTCSVFHLYPARLKRNECSKSRRQIFDELRKAGVGVNVHYIPVHTQPFYQQLGFKIGDFPVAEHYYQETISLPIYYELTDDNQNFIVTILSKVLA